MRCSDCFAEMKEGPDGLYCDACGTSLAPLMDDDGVQAEAPVAAPKPKRRWGLLLGAIMVAIIGGGAGWAYQTGLMDTLIASEPEAVAATLPKQSVIASDPDSLINASVSLVAEAGRQQLFAGATCQNVQTDPEAGVFEAEWIGFDGEIVARLSPALPRNWRLQALCRSEDGRVFASAALADGIAVSELSPDGGLIWSSILPASRGAAERAELLFGEQQIQILAPAEARGQFTLTAFDLDGARLWQRTLDNVNPRSRPVIATNQVGETVAAWNTLSEEQGIEARVQAVSPQNVSAYAMTLTDRTVPVSGLIGDDLAQSLLIEGQVGFSVQFINSVGAPTWRRWIDANASPIGAIQDGTGYVIAAHEGVRLLFWRLQDDGQVSQPIEVELSTSVSSGRLDTFDGQRAALAIRSENGAPLLLSIDLQRLREASDVSSLQAETVETPSIPEVSEEDAVEDRVDVPEETFTGPSPTIDPTPVNLDTDPIETAPEPLPATQGVSVAPDPVESQPQAAAPVEEAPATSTLSCTFRCAASGNPLATYPILQTIELEDGESLETVTPRLRASHKQLCELNGGQPVVESSPECTAQ